MIWSAFSLMAAMNGFYGTDSISPGGIAGYWPTRKKELIPLKRSADAYFRAYFEFAFLASSARAPDRMPVIE